MSVVATLGHTITCTIAYLDANGNPMLTPPAPDAPPAWTQTTPATETMAVSADGLTDVLTSVAAGTDVVGVTAVVGGATFTASLNVEVDPLPQVLTSIAINAAVSA